MCQWAEAMVTLKRLITEEINNYCRLQPSQCCPANSYPTRYTSRKVPLTPQSIIGVYTRIDTNCSI